MTARRHSLADRARIAIAAALLALLAACLLAPAAHAEFGVELYDVNFENADGSSATQAGSHPFAFNTRVLFDHHVDESGEFARYSVDEDLKDFFATQAPGLVGDATAYPTCDLDEFLTIGAGQNENLQSETECDEEETAVGAVVSGVGNYLIYSPLLNLTPGPGSAARLGFDATGVKVILDVGVKRGGDYNLIAGQRNIPEVFPVIGAKVQIWGDPADPRHDPIRGRCLANAGLNSTGTVPDIVFEHSPLAERSSCPTSNPERPFLTLPATCSGPLESSYAIGSWPRPASFLANGEPDLSDPAWMSGSVLTHDDAEPPRPQGFTGCARLGFAPRIASKATTDRASTGSGLDFAINFDQQGLTSSSGLAESTIEKAEITLPKGVTVDPSLAEGIEVCTEGDLANEEIDTAPGDGCPNGSKIGTVSVETPLLEGTVPGSVYLAAPYANPTGSLISFYIVLKDPGNGLLVKLPAKVAPDAKTGQLVTTVEEVPRLPFSHFRFHFREGQRAPLISPRACGTYETTAVFTPWSGTEPVTVHDSFRIDHGPGGSPCPGAALFHPGFEAGTLNNAAGSYSPFDMRITRADGEQDLSRFSAVLPPGVVGRIAGVPWCPEAGIAQARSRTGAHGGAAELNDPSCPVASQIGTTTAGAGVGSQLTYVPGRLYLAGPYHGDPLSVVSITPALAGPFDAGTVVVREALNLDPITAQVRVDGAASDPIPHILQGIPLSLRDLGVYADRPGFTLNATSCEPSLTLATLWGAGTVLAPTGEVPVGLATRYQAAGCQALGFEPRLKIRLAARRSTRGAFPRVRAVLVPRSGDANARRIAVLLPGSELIENSHFRTICTRVQYAANGGFGAGCPKGSIYGHATTWSPLLAQPLSGPVYLRSSNHKLPDLVVALHGIFDIESVARIDSVHGRIRATFEGIPDAPLSRVVLNMRGGRKGLIVNSTDICRGVHRARASMRAQSGKSRTLKPVVRTVKCKHKHKRKGKHGNKKGKRHKHGAKKY